MDKVNISHVWISQQAKLSVPEDKLLLSYLIYSIRYSFMDFFALDFGHDFER